MTISRDKCKLSSAKALVEKCCEAPGHKTGLLVVFRGQKDRKVTTPVKIKKKQPTKKPEISLNKRDLILYFRLAIFLSEFLLQAKVTASYSTRYSYTTHTTLHTAYSTCNAGPHGFSHCLEGNSNRWMGPDQLHQHYCMAVRQRTFIPLLFWNTACTTSRF